MKRTHATRVIVLLIIGVLIWQYVEKRKDLQCYVRQQASRLEFFYEAGYASEDDIRQVVRDDIADDFYGQAWRVALDQIFHAIFMGGNRGQQVIARLTQPPDDLPEFFCGGIIHWSIWPLSSGTVHREYTGTDLKTAHQVTTALQALPQDELWKYSVEADFVSYRDGLGERRSTYQVQYRDGGEVSAREWLDGKIVPEYMSGWYASWLEQWQDLQNVDEE